jgi:hypothetical protein
MRLLRHHRNVRLIYRAINIPSNFVYRLVRHQDIPPESLEHRGYLRKHSKIGTLHVASVISLLPSSAYSSTEIRTQRSARRPASCCRGTMRAIVSALSLLRARTQHRRYAPVILTKNFPLMKVTSDVPAPKFDTIRTRRHAECACTYCCHSPLHILFTIIVATPQKGATANNDSNDSITTVRIEHVLCFVFILIVHKRDGGKEERTSRNTLTVRNGGLECLTGTQSGC